MLLSSTDQGPLLRYMHVFRITQNIQVKFVSERLHVPLNDTALSSPVIPAIKTSANRVVNDFGELRLHESLHKRADVLLLTVGKIRRAVEGDQQLDLTSPARCKARAADTLRLLGLCSS